MSRPSAPALTVRYNGPPRTFAAGHDVVVGRDLRADIRIAHPLVSRAHVVLRFEHGRWTATDNGSLNGMFVHGRRVPAVDIADGTTVNLGSPDGPALSCEVRSQQGPAGRPPQTSTVVISPSYPPEPPSYQPPPFPPYAPPTRPTAPSPTPLDAAPTRMGPSAARSGRNLEPGHLDAQDPAAGVLTGCRRAARIADDRAGDR